jgi:hypothetical protein
VGAGHRQGLIAQVQTQGSLRDGGLSTLLQTMQSERATGTLAIEHGDESASLYFLFGHLFHASGPSGQGEDVVIGALGWDDGNYQFDPRAKLPAEETIKSSPAELLNAAQSRQTAVETAAAPSSSWRPTAEGDAGEAASDGADGDAFRSSVPAAATAAPASTGFDSGLASWAATQNDVVPPPGEPVAYPTATPSSEPEPEPELAPSPAASSPVITPESALSSTPRSTVLGAQQEAPDNLVYPLPSGRPHYEGLKSAFVDFPRLLRTLRADRHTGYIRLNGSGYSGIILLNDGSVLEAVCSDGSITKGEAAFVQFRRHMDSGDGMLDVIELDGEIVLAVGRLFTAAPLYTGLLGRFVNLEALLDYLGEEKVDGAVVVSGSTELGVILLGQGSILGAYTESKRDLDSSTTSVTKLASERSARIEVKSGSGSLIPIDVDSALNKQY